MVGLALASTTLVTTGIVAPAASATAAPKCASADHKPFTASLTVDGVTATASGQVSWTCRSVDVTGSLAVPKLPAAGKPPITRGRPPVAAQLSVCTGAEAQAPAYGATGRVLMLAAPSPLVCAHPGQTNFFSSGWVRPADLPGDVGTIAVAIGYGQLNGQYKIVTLHQPVF